MHRRLFTLFGSLLCTLLLFAALPASSSFTTEDEDPISEGGNWADESLGGNVVIVSNAFTGTAAVSNGIARWTADTPSADQYSQVVVVTDGGVGPAVRVGTGGTTHSGYIATVTSGTCYIARMVGGSASVLDTRSISGTPYTLRLEVSGVGATVTLKVFKNGAQQGADITDTDVARITDAGGLGITANGNGGSGDDWEGGNLGGSTAARRRIIN